ncbi:phosphotransferase family protein [Nonomuraea sp. NPDC050394]|uniref:phosphotransferase family protein n=1 Tax=Nonomuraea sp. NPDC050394 TaxID=3364363 RepID=UPI0037AEFF62
MRAEDLRRVSEALGSPVTSVSTLAGGFSHETCLLELPDGQVVVRLGGPDPAIEAAVMAVARDQVPVPEVLHVLPGAMILEYVPGIPLSEAFTEPAMKELGHQVGEVVAQIATVTFDRPGFFSDANLSIPPESAWSEQLPAMAATCMAAAGHRLDPATREAWLSLCTAHAPALSEIDAQSHLVHADINPKNILVTRPGGTWQVAAILDWEFSYSGSPYGDAANMTRFAADYPEDFVNAFREAFGSHHPDGWEYLGWVLDMFALSDLVTRPPGHQIADQAATRIRTLTTQAPPHP